MSVIRRKNTSAPLKRMCDRTQHDELCIRAEKYLLNTLRCGFAFHELRSMSDEEPDAIGWKDGIKTTLIECKTSRSDFQKDTKKHFRRNPELGMGVYRYMMCPPDLIKPNELPDGWGLLYCYPKKIKRIVESEVHERSMKNEMLMLYTALRRLNIRGRIPEIYDYRTARRAA